MIKMRKLLIISGPTATGKTKLALKLAKLFGGELISADSRQVYKGMDIGTGKDRGTENRKQKTEFTFGDMISSHPTKSGARLTLLNLPTSSFLKS